ncbi:OsmC family protein [Jeotgalibaca sp. MA1X17-3]|uniref:OsmC family protein n=1 Tax=Jeotgalibaca sp. MA1X17-3 TaxID=2908211 RepID=UPI001F3A044E|nr:OsmC family protein [Jeotgalibaca sp. MA1X17-3]UJF14764.1 OsmC family protein [Jeotgalibaca sp. MA1X17-3]
MSKDSLFHAEMINEDGISGTAFVRDGLSVQVSSVTSPQKGTNPEELLGLSWATCLNATIQSLLKGRGTPAKSKVVVHVDLKKKKNFRNLF